MSRREENDREREFAKEYGFEKHKSPSVAKLALNRLYIPKEEPPKWYPGTSLHPFREDAVREAADIIRNKEAQYAKVYREWTEDGVMWGVKTYPRIIPWYVKEGLVKDDVEDRKKKSSKAKPKRKPVKKITKKCKCK